MYIYTYMYVYVYIFVYAYKFINLYVFIQEVAEGGLSGEVEEEEEEEEEEECPVARPLLCTPTPL
jgi:hypothetical protein